MNHQQLTLKTLPITNRRGIFTTMALWFLMNAGFFLLIPLLSVHFVEKLGWAAAFIGIVLALRQFLQQSLTVFGGALADRVGAKGLILLGLLIRVMSFILIGYVTTPLLLMVSAILAAVGGALFDAPNKAILAALAPDALLPDIYGKVGILQNAARTVGPMIGALLINVNFRVVGLTAAGFFAFAFIVALLGLPKVDVSTDRQPARVGLQLAFHDRIFITYTVLMMGYWFMWVQMSIALPLKANALTGMISSAGMLLTVNAVIAMAVQIPALKLAHKYLNPLPVLIVGVVSMAFGLGTVSLVTSIEQLYLSIAFYALGSVLATPNAQTVAAIMVNPRARGAYFGVNSLSLAVGGGVGQVMGGTMVDLAARFDLPALPWLVSSLVGLAAAAGLYFFYSHHRLKMTPTGMVRQVGD